MVSGMGNLLRFLLTALAGAFIAMFAEPFFSALLLAFNIDTAKWAWPVIMFMSDLARQAWFRLLGAGVIGSATGAWLHWVATKWDRRGMRPMAADTIEKIKDIGEDCIALGQDIAEFKKDREENAPNFFSENNGGGQTNLNAASRFSRVTVADFQRRFAARLEGTIALLRVLCELEVHAEFVSRSYYYQHDMVRFLSGVGNLLRRGHVEEARKLSETFRVEDSQMGPAILKGPTRPNVGLHIDGANIFVPDENTSMTGIALNAKVWNAGSDTILIDWDLRILPADAPAVAAQITIMPPLISMQHGEPIKGSESLLDRLGSRPVPSTPLEGILLFYAKIPKQLVIDPDTVIELCARDIHSNSFTFKHRMGDWLSIHV